MLRLTMKLCNVPPLFPAGLLHVHCTSVEAAAAYVCVFLVMLRDCDKRTARSMHACVCVIVHVLDAQRMYGPSK